MSLQNVRPLGVALMFLTALAAGPSLSATPAVKGNAVAGKAIFATKCVACHKADGAGGLKLTGNPTPNWKDPKVWADPKRTDAYLRDCITNGKPKSGMVAWGKTKQLKPAQIEDLIAHIHTFKKK
ncbi:MAG: cytochrome c [Candidatus Eisenbacteria bacterium]